MDIIIAQTISEGVLALRSGKVVYLVMIYMFELKTFLGQSIFDELINSVQPFFEDLLISFQIYLF